MIDLKFGRRGYIPRRYFEIKLSPVDTCVPLYTNCRVHLHSRNGTYIVSTYNNTHAVITCQVWKNQKSYGTRQDDYEIIPRSDIKCHYGGGRGKFNSKIL